MFTLRVFKRCVNITSKKADFSSSPKLRKDLQGRDIIQPEDLTLDDWKRILWVAIDLKKATKCRTERLNLLCNKHVALIFARQTGRNLLSCTMASHLLSCSTTLYTDQEFELRKNYEDYGRALSQLSDLIIVNDCQQSVLPKLADGSCMPVISVSSNMFSILQSVAFLMTIQEKFGQLNRIKLAWIGPSTPLCNTILTLYPTFGINLRILCICAHGSGQISPVTYESALLSCHKGSAEIHQCSSVAEAIYRSHVIITSCHPEEESILTCEVLEEADLQWILLHALPRTDIEITDNLFRHENNMTWHACANYLYAAMALITVTLSSYQPVSNMPTFKIL